jgi:hypothetical protein
MDQDSGYGQQTVRSEECINKRCFLERTRARHPSSTVTKTAWCQLCASAKGCSIGPFLGAISSGWCSPPAAKAMGDHVLLLAADVLAHFDFLLPVERTDSSNLKLLKDAAPQCITDRADDLQAIAKHLLAKCA